MLTFLLYLWFDLTTSVTQIKTTINAQTAQSTLKDVSISLNSHSVAISNTNYYVNVQSQDAYDIKLSMSPKYSFDSYYNSTLILTINGATPFPDEDGDLLIVFSVGNVQYFSFFLHLDTNNIRSRIYPSISLSQNNVSEWIYDTITYAQRWNRVSNNNQWIQLNEWRNQALWPLKFIIKNNPIQQISHFKFIHDCNNTNAIAVSYDFNAAFVDNKQLDVYIMGDSKNEQFIVSSFDILLENTAPTISPTIFPSNIPTKSPTFSPLHLIINTKNERDKQLDTSDNSDNTHILIFTILISSATCVVILQILCMLQKRIKRKYFTNVAISKNDINDNEMECKHAMDDEIVSICNKKSNVNVNNNGNRKDTYTTSTTERFEYNLDGRRTQVNDFELKRPNSETITYNNNGYGNGYMYAFGNNKRNYFYEGIKGIGDEVSVTTITTNEPQVFDINEMNGFNGNEKEESAFKLMDEQTVNKYWKNHANIQFISKEHHT